MPSLRIWGFYLLLGLLTFCEKKYPRVNYLSPRDRENNGFVDQDTWQQVSWGYFFPPQLTIKEIETLPVYYPLPEGFSYDNLSKFSQEVYLNKPEVKVKISFQKFFVRDLLALKEEDELLYETNPEKLSEPLVAKIEIKKNLFYYACDHAYASGLNHFLLLLDSSKKDGITKEYLSALDARFFPLPNYYFAEVKKALELLKSLVTAKKLNHEVISEKPDVQNPFRCKIVIHFKLKDLILKEPVLLQLTQTYD